MSLLLLPKDKRLELPALTRLANGAPCSLLVPDVCCGRDETTVWCHSNMSRHGRGAFHKSHDCYGALGCVACHHWLDFGKATRAEKEEAFQRGMERTLFWLWSEGKVRVA